VKRGSTGAISETIHGPMLGWLGSCPISEQDQTSGTRQLYPATELQSWFNRLDLIAFQTVVVGRILKQLAVEFVHCMLAQFTVHEATA
jgi:hypothetical protein